MSGDALARASTTDVPARTNDGSALLERVVVIGDLSKLTPKERLHYYERLCASLGLNPLTRPFKYLQLSGQLTLYTTKDATEQLRLIRGVSVTKLEKESDEDTHTVTAYGRDRDGREDVATGVVSIANLRGEAKANAKMKCETKAKRRLTLSLCGLGVLDESEIDSAVVGGRVDVDPDTGEIQTDLRHDALAEAEPGARPPGEPDPEADVLLGKIQAGFDMLKVRAPEQAELWRSFCGQAAFMTTTADVASLGQLYDHLAARYRDEVKGKK